MITWAMAYMAVNGIGVMNAWLFLAIIADCGMVAMIADGIKGSK